MVYTMEHISSSGATEQEYEMPVTSALLKYYFHRVATKIATPKNPDERDLRAREVRRRAKRK
jgi:hypothetical protein